MTATVDAVREFKHLLPRYASTGLHDTQRLVAMLARALDHGWTPARLARECGRDLAGVTNAPAVVMWRLEKAAEHPPPDTSSSRKTPLCGECVDGWQVDPDTRLPIARCGCRTNPKKGTQP